jgi:hypothetical protein
LGLVEQELLPLPHEVIVLRLLPAKVGLDEGPEHPVKLVEFLALQAVIFARECG